MLRRAGLTNAGKIFAILHRYF